MCESGRKSEEDKDFEKKVEDFNKRYFEKLRSLAKKVEYDEQGRILLDRNNPLHREWYEDDEK